MGGIYAGVLIVIVVLRYMVGRRPAAYHDLPAPRERQTPEHLLTWAGGLVTLAVHVELFVTQTEHLAAYDGYWLNLLPLLWLGLTLCRRDIPGDRTATNVGLWTVAPYAAYALSPKEMPESTWLSLCLFGAAFLVGVLRDERPPA